MEKRLPSFQQILGSILPWIVLLILVGYTYARFFVALYPGFYFDPESGEVTGIYTENAQAASLQVGDNLIQVGSVTINDFLTDLGQNLFEGAHQGQTVPIIVERGGQQLTVSWQYPLDPRQEIIQRLSSYWWLSYIFWFFGTLTVMILRPRDDRWRLLIAFNYLTAIWLLVGTLSAWRVWNCTLVMRAAIWMCIPVYWNLHWVFPKPLGKAPAAVWVVLYSVGSLIAVAQWFQLLPSYAFFFGFLLAVLGSIILLVIRFFIQPALRRELGLLAAGVALTLTPTIALVIAGLIGSWKPAGAVSLLGLPILPGVYFYVAHRRRLGPSELRANRFIALYLFIVLLVSAMTLLTTIIYAVFPPSDTMILLGLVGPFLAALFTVFGFASFQRWVEQRLLGMPLPPARLLETYAERITITQDTPSLIHLLTEEVLPSLLVRQSALLRVDENCRMATVYRIGVEDGDLPQDCNDPRLLTNAGHYRLPATMEQERQPVSWVRLALPLKLGGEQVGLWLLGRRDPDDFYAQAEIAIFQALANQTAVALTNILQTERLHALYQADIEREEAERSRLARELHDDVLGQMAMLRINAGDGASPQFAEAYQSAVGHVREIINGLRPAMLSYGLQAAIEELSDESPGLVGGAIPIRVDLPPSEVRYPPAVELHLFRIIQQACQNALVHAQASDICIAGCLASDQATLTVEDNGIGFETGESLNLIGLLANRHFGLAGMYERASLISARLQIDSTPQHGTRLKVVWSQGENHTGLL